MHDAIDVTTAQGRIAIELCDAIQHRWPAEVQAIAVTGSLAHDDAHADSDVNLVVVTYRDGAGPQPTLRKIDGILVDLRVCAADESLARARELTPHWPLEADPILTSWALHDPHGWFATLRNIHLSRLAEARPPEFNRLARHNWELASAALARAVRLAQWYQTDPALVLLAQARLHAALVAGLLTRTYFRNTADAVKQAGTAGSDMRELAAVLKSQADELTARGWPVDGPLNDFFD